MTVATNLSRWSHADGRRHTTRSASRTLTGVDITYGLHWLSRCVTIARCGQGTRSALLQTRYGAGICREPTMAIPRACRFGCSERRVSRWGRRLLLRLGARWQRFCDHEPMQSRRVQWAVAGALGGWAAARLAGADRLRFAEAWAVPLLSFTPQVTAAAWASALLLRGAGPAAASAVAGAALTAAVGPRAVPSRQPPAAGPVLRVLTANLLVGRAGVEAVAELVCRKHADVLFVQELTGEAAARLQRAGLGDLLPHRVTEPVPHGERGSIYARYPLRGGPVAALWSATRCTARLDLPSGEFVQLACIHPAPPKPPWSPGATARWRGQLSALPAPGDSPRILAGDFNATLDHAQFRRLLRRGYVDAASQAGNGLSLTWGPRPDRRLTLLAIDHVLIDRRCAVLATSAHWLTGSDHRALYAELRLPAPHSRRDQASPKP